jgi:Rad3-related DNA helicase
MQPKALWTKCEGHKPLLADRKVKASQIKRRTPKQPIRKQSKAMEKRLVEYHKRKEAFLTSKYCQLCCQSATDLHHKKGRLGKNLLDENTWMALCRQHHSWIHQNPKWSYAEGWLEKR